MDESRKQIIIVGGGPVGTLTALFLGRKGFKVDLYEARPDIRLDDNTAGRSISLTLSLRGMTALKYAGIDKKIENLGVPMYSGYFHSKNGMCYEIPYETGGEHCLLSISRLELNRQLLTEAEKSENVKIHFGHKLIKCDTLHPSVIFKTSEAEEYKTADILIGCDGAHSAVRRQMLKGRIDYSQTYIDLGYKEFRIPPTKKQDFALAPHHVHFWPRNKVMLAAFPNIDKSFTCTLTMPFEMYASVVTGDDVIHFFQDNFAELIPMIGELTLRSSFFNTPPLSLISIKCSSFHCGKTLIIGDAAHAMAIFSGQGLNSGLEDALILDRLLDNFAFDISQILPKFSEVRVSPAHAAVDLSLYNYKVLGSQARKPWFILRRKIENFLHSRFPSVFAGRISLIHFTTVPYDKAQKMMEKQEKLIESSMGIVGGFMFASIVYILYRTTKRLSAV
uniref:kynurenine 3-monooxygenase-like n=1 Tax=Styela clava TaxID=7725 RepID=UPI00193A7242|nr:kynurenine 3-monooxygenase-like [Styela clava]